MQTFAPGYQKPGAYFQTEYQTAPQAIIPSFVTALVGRTSPDKPTSKTILRNNDIGYNVPLNANGNVGTAVVDADETYRRDLIDSSDKVYFSSSIPVVNSVVDAMGMEHLRGSKQSWVAFATGDTPSDNVYVEWVAKYRVTLGASGTVILAGGIGSGAAIEIAGITEETGFSDQTTAISSADGAHTGASGVLVECTDATTGGYSCDISWGAGATVTVTGITGTSEQVLTEVDAVSKIKVIVYKDRLFDTVSATGVYNNNVTVYTAGPAAANGAASGTYVATTYGTKVSVGYQAPKTASDIAVTRYDNLADLQAYHGALVETTSPDYLSLAAVPYFINGGGTVVTVPLKDKLITLDSSDPDLTNDAGYVEAVRLALEMLEDQADVSNVIVLSPTESSDGGNFRSTILDLVKSHVLNMSTVTGGKPRMAINGARANTENELVFELSAMYSQSNRMIYLAPATASLVTGGFVYVCDGSTIAAGLAGILSNPAYNASESINDKVILGFSDIPDPFTATIRGRLALNGCTVISKESGAPAVMDFLTTDQSEVLQSDGVVTRIEIDFRRTIVPAINAAVINKRFLDNKTFGTIRSIVSWVRSLKVTQEILQDVQITKLAKNITEPRQVDLELAILPVFTLKWVYIKATFLAQ